MTTSELDKAAPLKIQVWQAYRRKEVIAPGFEETLDKNFTENVVVVRRGEPEIMTGEDLADLLDELGAGEENFVNSPVDKVEITAICEELGIQSGDWICFEKTKTKDKIKGLPSIVYFKIGVASRP